MLDVLKMKSLQPYVVIVEEQHKKKANWQRDENPFDLEVPKVNQPVSRLCWLEGSRYWNNTDARCFQSARKVGESNPEKSCDLMGS